MNLTIQQKPMPQSIQVFHAMHKEVFGRDALPQERPSTLWLFRSEDEVVGFMSGYATDAMTFYVQRIGATPAFRQKRWLYRELYRQIEEPLKKAGVRYLTGTIRADNPAPLVVALRTGWVVHGYKVNTNGAQYVQVIKDLAGQEV